jgi:hypothetical protein
VDATDAGRFAAQICDALAGNLPVTEFIIADIVARASALRKKMLTNS